MGVYVLAHELMVPDNFQQTLVSDIQNKAYKQGNISFDETDPDYPGRSDLKIMRSDTIAAVITAQRLIGKIGESINREKTALFVSSGSFIERIDKHLGHLLEAFEKIMASSTEQEKLRHIYRASPPLLALQTLTNSTMSFVAQYTGIKGNNATFGNTSLAGFEAIKAGFSEVKHEHNTALVVGSNVGSELSFANNNTLTNETGEWSEGTAASSILLGTKNENALCRIDLMKVGRLPDLSKKQTHRSWNTLIPDDKGDAIVFSGAFTQEQNEKDYSYCQTICEKAISSFDQKGNLGPVNLFNSLQMGISMILDGAENIDIVDSDIYGRESHIRISKH